MNEQQNQARTGPTITSEQRRWTLEWELESLVAMLPPDHTTTNLTKNNITPFKNTVMESVIARTVHFQPLPYGPFNWAKVGPEVSRAGPGSVA